MRAITLSSLALGIACSANAGVTMYTDEATFLAALGAHTTHDFENYAAGTVITNQLPGINAVTTNGNLGSTQAEVGSIAGLPFPMSPSTSSGDRFLSSELSPPTYATAGLRFQMALPATGVGMYVVDGSPLAGFEISLTSGGSSLGTYNFGPQTVPSSFVGVISDTAFDYVAVGSASEFDSWGIDDLSHNAVPEPGTLAALGLGMAALRRRRR